MSWTSEAQEPAEFHWAVDPSFLTGASGTALALLAAACAQEPEWDAVLLMPRLLQHEGGLQ